MANHTGVDGIVTAGGATVGELKGFSIDESATVIDNSTLNSAAQSNVAGRTSWTATIEVQWDETDTGQGNLGIGQSVTVVFLPEGNTTGDARFTGTAIVNSVGKAVADEAIITQTFGLTGSGALVEDTVP